MALEASEATLEAAVVAAALEVADADDEAALVVDAALQDRSKRGA